MKIVLTVIVICFSFLFILSCDDTSYPFQQINYPFTFYYELPDSGTVSVIVQNSYLVTVRELVINEEQSAGSHQVDWDLDDQSGNRVDEGLYFIKVYLDGYVIITEMYEVYQ